MCVCVGGDPLSMAPTAGEHVELPVGFPIDRGQLAEFTHTPLPLV